MSIAPNEWTILSMLKWGTGYFEQKNIADPRHSIEWLLADVLDIKRLDLYINYDRPLSSAELDALRPRIKRRASHEPLQYITGFSEFVNARIAVTPEVLIPRIETEQLVEIILADHTDQKTFSVLDIGTGSGCIPVALKMERPGWELSALDISEQALAVARQNAKTNETDIIFHQADIRQPGEASFDSSFDIIVSNPPYILPSEKETLDSQVKNHEPSLALFCNNLEMMYENIVHFSTNHLASQGSLYVEINEHYPDRILSVFPPEIWKTTLLKDYARKPRFIKAKRKS